MDWPVEQVLWGELFAIPNHENGTRNVGFKPSKHGMRANSFK